MKKQLLFDIRKMSFKIAALAFFILLTIQSSFAQSWPLLGNENGVSSIASTHTSVAVVADVPYVAYVEMITLPSSGTPATGLAKVKKRQADGTWVQVGPNLSQSGASFTRIFANANGDLYVSYIDGTAGSKLIVKKFNTTTQVWDTVGGTGVYVSTGSATNTVSQFKETNRSSMAFDSSNTPYIAYIEATGLVPTVKKFDGTNWVTQGSAIINSTTTLAEIAHGVSLVIDETDTPWLSLTSLATTTALGGTLTLYKLTGGTWTAPTTTTTSGRHSSMTLTSSGNLAIVFFNTGDTNRANAIEYNRTTATWGTTTRLGSRDSVNINLTKDASGNLYCSFIDAVTASFLQSARVFKQAAGATIWTELKDPNVVRGVDEPAGWISIATSSTVPFIVYTKANLAANVATPIVRKYDAPVGTAPAITNFTPAFTATAPLPSVAFTISGFNFTGATDVTFGGNPVTSFVINNDSSISGITSATPVSNSTISVTTPNGTATLTGTPPSALSYPSAVSTYNGASWAPTVTAAGTLIYSISPALTGGLSFNSGTGVIGGQATGVVASATYTITATNNFGNTTTTVTFGTAGIAPTAFSYTPAALASYTTGTAITPLAAVITLNSGTATYTVSPSLPAGLALDPATGGISGTPTAVTAGTVYTVKATTEFGFTTRLITFATTAPLGTDSFEKSDAVKAYPNPTTDIVTVNLPDSTVVEKIEVYNNLGQLMLTESKNTVSLQHLTNGIYFLTIHTSEGNYSKKIIKN